jgi:List-Bact-rpt repeat protein
VKNSRLIGLLACFSILFSLPLGAQVSYTHWNFLIRATNSQMTDSLAMPGVRSDATADFDNQYDIPRPPRSPSGTYVEVYFPHSGSNYPPILGTKYAIDFRGPDDPLWNMSVEASSPGPLTLSWDSTYVNSIEPRVQLFLRDTLTGVMTNMRQRGSYSFNYTTKRNFQITTIIDTVHVIAQTNPPGLSILVDGIAYSSPHTFAWIAGVSHTISTDSIQTGTVGTRYLWYDWADAGTRSHTFVPLSDSTITANFTTQYYLTIIAGAGGSVAPSNNWYNAGETPQISATPEPGRSFGSWNGSGTGSYSGSANPSTVTMSGPITETASFALIPIHVTVQTNPSGLSFTVDGAAYTSTQTFIWDQGAAHEIATSSPQSVSAGTRYLWNNWSNGGTISNMISPVGDTTFTANFLTQYALTLGGTAGGTASATPANTWYNPGATVQITATPNTGFSFVLWKGVGPGSYTGTNNPATVTMNGPILDSANFRIDTFTIIPIAGPHGSISPSDTVKIAYGSDPHFMITPNAGYHIDSVFVDGAPVDSTTSYTFTNVKADHTIRAQFRITQVTYSVDVQARWNLLSVPLEMSDCRTTSMFPHAISRAVTYIDSYVLSDSINYGRAYWLRFSSAETIPLTGDPVNVDTIPVQEGWNMVGSVARPISDRSIVSVPPGLVTSHFFSYTTSGYFHSDSVFPGKGYWVKVNHAGILILGSEGGAASAGTIRIVSTREDPPTPPSESGIAQDLPRTYSLEQNFPNPFNPSTIIQYALPVESKVSLRVFDVLGRLVDELKNDVESPGYKEVRWSPEHLPSGVYFYRLDLSGPGENGLAPVPHSFSAVKKMVLMK